MEPLLIVALVVVLFAVTVLMKAVRIVPQARARNVERLGRYHTHAHPGLNFVDPLHRPRLPDDRPARAGGVLPPQPVITEDNLVVEIDTVLYFQVTDPRAAAYEIANYIQAVEQLTVTTLRNVVGSHGPGEDPDLPRQINSQLRGVLDEATGKWGIRVNRVEIKADRPAEEHQGRDGEADARRARQARRDPHRRGPAQSQILTAEGDKQSAILRAEGERSRRHPAGRGPVPAIDQVFQAVHRNDPDPKLLAYQYLQTLPRARAGPGQHVLGDPERGHLGAVRDRAGLRAGRGAAGEGNAGAAPAPAPTANGHAALVREPGVTPPTE